MQGQVFGFGGSGSFQIAALPDTQNYCEHDPSMFNDQVNWIVNNAATQDIKFVTHLGDVVDHGDNATEWGYAVTAMAPLFSSQIPFGVCIGNHDYDVVNEKQGLEEDGYPELITNFLTNFGPSQFASYSWYGGADRRGTSSYQIFNAGGIDWLNLSIEYQPDDEVLQWAQEVLDAHPTMPVIYSTHSYINHEGYLASGATAQWFKFISNNDQIIVVLNGHHFDTTTDAYAESLLVQQNIYGNDVFAMCSNYQGTGWGDGYIRLLEFDLDNNQINVKTYSTETNTYRTNPESQFTLSIDFAARFDNLGSREVINSVQAANITVVQNDDFNTAASVTVSIPTGESTADMALASYEYPGGVTDIINRDTGLIENEVDWIGNSKGDYGIQVGSRYRDDALGGVFIASVRENGRYNAGMIERYHTLGVDTGSHGQTWIATSGASVTYGGIDYASLGEDNVNVAVAYFPFSGGWTCASMRNLDNGLPMWAAIGSDDIVLGENLVRYPTSDEDPNLIVQKPQPTSGTPYWNQVDGDRAIWELTLPGVNSITDGVLLVCGGKNENNYAMASPHLDGRGWQIAVSDNGSNAGNTECDPFNLVYVPYETENIVAGRVSGRAGILSGTGDFSVTRLYNGGHRLEIEGYTPADGTLLISSELEWYNDDDIVTYEAEGDHWIVESRDLYQASLTNSTQAQYVFVFIPFDTPPVAPGPAREFDYTQVLAGNFDVTWQPDPNNFANVQMTEGSEGYNAAWHDKGSFVQSINGYRTQSKASGITMGTIREFVSNDGDGTADYVGTISSYDYNQIGINKPFVDPLDEDGYGIEAGCSDFAAVWIPKGSGYTWGDVRDTGELYVNATDGNAYDGFVPTVIANYVGNAGPNNQGRYKYTFAEITPADGILFTTGRTTYNLMTSVMPLTDGWEVTMRLNVSPVEESFPRWARYAFFPYDSDTNIVAHVAADGSIVKSTGGVTVAKTGVGTFNVNIAGATPQDGALLMTVYSGDTTNGAINAFPVYEDDGNGGFNVKCYSFAAETRVEVDCDFAFAYVPFAAAPLPFIGSGTEADPYQIWTKEDLASIKRSMSSCYKLMADIDLGSVVYSDAVIKVDGVPFTGSFDGNGFTISNLTINAPTTDYVGLFGLASPGVELKNLTLTNVSVVGNDKVAGLVGHNYTSDITNCHVAGSVDGYNYVGGLIGYNSTGAISNCSVDISVTGGNYRVGGLIGYTRTCTIDNCSATGIVDVPNSDEVIGGLIGMASDFSIITNCYADVTVIGYERVGGLIGNTFNSTVSNCYATGDVTGTAVSANNTSGTWVSRYYAGGLIGQNHTTDVSNCYATGTVTAEGMYRVGGLAGNNWDASLSDSYATGTVSGRNQAGGLVGYNDGQSLITGSYATGNVSAVSTYAGGLVGESYRSDITNSYATGNAIANYEAGGCVGRITYDYTNDLGCVISNCYATGSVESGTRPGGFIGGCFGSDNLVENCYSTGVVTGSGIDGNRPGGFVGGDPSATITNCFWDTETSGITVSAKATGKTTAEMKTQSTFTGWDFATVWDIVEAVSYPTLSWQSFLSADLDFNGSVNTADLQILAADWLSVGTGLPGDLDGDNKVELSDLAIMASQWTVE